METCLYRFFQLKRYQMRNEEMGLEQIEKPAVVECARIRKQNHRRIRWSVNEIKIYNRAVEATCQVWSPGTGSGAGRLELWR